MEEAKRFIKLIRTPRADIPCPQYCKVLQELDTGIVAMCYNQKMNDIALTFLVKHETAYEFMPSIN